MCHSQSKNRGGGWGIRMEKEEWVEKNIGSIKDYLHKLSFDNIMMMRLSNLDIQIFNSRHRHPSIHSTKTIRARLLAQFDEFLSRVPLRRSIV